MAGGIRTNWRRRCARRWAAGIWSALVLATAAVASADDLADRPAAAVRGSHRPDERSIVVENSRAPSDEPATALATDRPEEELQPIADSAEYGVQPELAEGVAGRPTPTLADAPAHNDSPATDETHEDFLADATASDGQPSPDGHDFVLAEDSAEEAVFQAASFNGIVPGESTRADLLKAWGQPLEQTTAGKTLSFDIDGFQAVAVSLLQDRVTAIRVELNRPASAEELVQKLRLSEYRPAYVKDDDGNVVSTIYPERGVTLGHAPDLGARGAPSGATQRSAAGVAAVYELVMRPIEATAFLRRAEATPRVEYAHRIADLEAAVDLDPNDVRANCQLAEAKLAVGEPLAAESIAAAAVSQQPADDGCRLQWAKCLLALGRRDDAAKQIRKILDGTTASPIDRADALQTMAELAASGAATERSLAIPLHAKAIELADTMADDPDAATRSRARRVLLAAHLGMCERIACGEFQNKDQSVEQWLSRASALAEQMIVDGQADVSLRLQVARSGLAAGGRLDPPIDPALWVAEAEQAAAEAEPMLKDEMARQRLHWELGLAYWQAAEIQHRRGDAELAIRYAEQAERRMTPLRPSRSEMPDTDYLLGCVYFQIGAAHAVHQKDHDAACQWYDRAVDLLLPATPAAHPRPGQQGDALVSMGVSYWEIGQRDRAYELTKAGSELIAQGVSAGLLADSSLAVPRGNLAAMGRALGIQQATEQLADNRPAEIGPSKRRSSQLPGRLEAPSRTATRPETIAGEGVRRR